MKKLRRLRDDAIMRVNTRENTGVSSVEEVFLASGGGGGCSSGSGSGGSGSGSSRRYYRVHLDDGSVEEVDLILLATGE